MSKLLPLLTLLCASAFAQLRADIQHDTPAGQATMRVYDGQKLLFQATMLGLLKIRGKVADAAAQAALEQFAQSRK